MKMFKNGKNWLKIDEKWLKMTKIGEKAEKMVERWKKCKQTCTNAYATRWIGQVSLSSRCVVQYPSFGV